MSKNVKPNTETQESFFFNDRTFISNKEVQKQEQISHSNPGGFIKLMNICQAGLNVLPLVLDEIVLSISVLKTFFFCQKVVKIEYSLFPRLITHMKGLCLAFYLR